MQGPLTGQPVGCWSVRISRRTGGATLDALKFLGKNWCLDGVELVHSVLTPQKKRTRHGIAGHESFLGLVWEEMWLVLQFSPNRAH